MAPKRKSRFQIYNSLSSAKESSPIDWVFSVSVCRKFWHHQICFFICRISGGGCGADVRWRRSARVCSNFFVRSSLKYDCVTGQLLGIDNAHMKLNRTSSAECEQSSPITDRLHDYCFFDWRVFTALIETWSGFKAKDTPPDLDSI